MSGSGGVMGVVMWSGEGSAVSRGVRRGTCRGVVRRGIGEW